MSEFEAERILGKEETNTFMGAIEFDADALEKDCFEFYHYHFRNLESRNLIHLCKENDDAMIRILKP